MGGVTMEIGGRGISISEGNTFDGRNIVLPIENEGYFKNISRNT